MNENVPLAEKMSVAANLKHRLEDVVVLGRAKMTVRQFRPMPDGTMMEIGEAETVENLITNAGRDFLHNQGYGTAGLGSNGLNYIALSNDTVTETASSTTLSSEITLNGLARAQGAVSHTGGTNTTSIDKTFTATGAQAAQKAALFTLSAAGTMNHVLGFTQRSLITNDTLQITFTITLG